jgi:Spy/CpxP family protein refolding chaperone
MWALGSAVLVMGLVVSTGMSGGEKKVKGQLPPNWKKLGLSKTQIEKVYDVQTKYRTKIKALEQQLDDLKAQRQKELLTVLTPDQKQKLSALTTGEERKTPSKEK